MTTYYVDPVNGADANNGLGPDASAVTNKPWKTVAKAVGASGMASGDTLYLSPGVFREIITVTLAPTGTTSIIGDPQNKQGFKDASGVVVPGGPVILSSWQSGDKANPPNGRVWSAASKNFYSFSYINFINNNQSGAYEIFQTSADTHDYTFTDCSFFGIGSSLFSISQSTFGTALNFSWDRCIFYEASSSYHIDIGLTKGSGADYDIGVSVKNCVFYGGSSFLRVTSAGGSGANAGNGFIFRNNTCHICLSVAIDISIISTAGTTFPSKVYNNIIVYSLSIGIRAGSTGQLLEDYNWINSTTPRTNVAVGTHSISDRSYNPYFHFGQERISGQFLRHFGEPTAGSALLGYGNDGNQSSYDNRNNPRPAGGLSALPAVGALERSNTWGQEATTVRTGTYAISCIGPGYQDFLIPVDGTSTTVSVYLRFDSNYTGTKPKIQVLANDELGLSAAEDTVTASADTWDQRSVTFTASKAGLVTVRLLSSDTSGYGRALADDFAVA